MSSVDECTGAYYIDEVATIVSNIIGLFITTYLGFSMHSLIATRKRKGFPSVWYFAVLYYTSLCAAFAVQMGSIFSVNACLLWDGTLGIQIQGTILIFCVYLAYVLMLSCLLLSFILRLHVTFRHTTYEIPTVKLYICLGSLITVDAIGITSAVIYWLHEYLHVDTMCLIIDRTLFFEIQLCTFVVYLMASIWAVVRFVRNLMALAELRSETLSPRRLQADSSVLEDQLNMVKLSSKYASLFVLAIGTSMVSLLCTVVVRIYLSELLNPGFFWPLDPVINMICLHLYHAEAQPHFDRYCSRLTRCCTRSLRRNVSDRNKQRMKSVSLQSKSVTHQSIVSVSIQRDGSSGSHQTATGPLQFQSPTSATELTRFQSPTPPVQIRFPNTPPIAEEDPNFDDTEMEHQRK